MSNILMQTCKYTSSSYLLKIKPNQLGQYLNKLSLGKGKLTHKICLKPLQKGVGGGELNKLVEIKAELSLQKWK